MQRVRPLLVLLFLTACEPQPVLIDADRGAADAASATADVQLPPVPSLELLDTPSRYPDQSWSVAGLHLERDTMRDQAVSVTGILQEIYVCEVPLPAPTGEAAAPAPTGPSLVPQRVRAGCKGPHLFISDTLRSRQRLLVTGYNAAWYEPQLIVGQRYVFDGRFAQQTSGFISTDDGLLVVTGIRGNGVTDPAATGTAPAAAPAGP